MEVFRAGGNGGQKQNKTSSGVRLRHPESGAVAESREHTSQLQNKKAAFRRLAETPEMQTWLRKKTSEMMMSKQERERIEAEIARNVERAMAEENLMYEVHGEDGQWVRVETIESS